MALPPPGSAILLVIKHSSRSKLWTITSAADIVNSMRKVEASVVGNEQCDKLISNRKITERERETWKWRTEHLSAGPCIPS
ncbi:hypothetical protein OJAV_G00077250 [Oryzias javanicus]|uniref:Uncharacterized protein n=1 Tax=Oryzias javanicus TaxID=123683 RepID=A0A3S2M7A0_ORYJA|nr:hypothetical protein OJAV_G00077250 [Oryzias javanicus]